MSIRREPVSYSQWMLLRARDQRAATRSGLYPFRVELSSTGFFDTEGRERLRTALRDAPPGLYQTFLWTQPEHVLFANLSDAVRVAMLVDKMVKSIG